MTLDLFPKVIPPHARHDQIGRPKRRPTRTRRGMYIDDRSVSELQSRILRVLERETLTHDEIRQRINALYGSRYSQNNVRSRCSELHRKKDEHGKPGTTAWLIMAHDFRPCRETGENKHSWALTPLGRDGLERLNKKP